MSPQTIPWIICGASCILPFLIGTGAFWGWCSILNRFPSREVITHTDEDGRKHITTHWIWLTREERKFRKQPEDKE